MWEIIPWRVSIIKESDVKTMIWLRNRCLSISYRDLKNLQIIDPNLDVLFFRKLEEADASFLEMEISVDEIKNEVWSCAGTKSPGFNFNFINFFWDYLKLDFFNWVKYFGQTGKLANGCNPSFIVLIPTKSDPLDISDYRPISLIGSIYKVVS